MRRPVFPWRGVGLRLEKPEPCRVCNGLIHRSEQALCHPGAKNGNYSHFRCGFRTREECAERGAPFLG